MDIKILKKLFEDNFISNFIINNKEQNIIIENFDVIVFIFDHMVNELTVNTNLVLEESNFEITNKEEKEKEKEKENTNKKLYYDDLFVGIYNHYLNIDRTNNYYTHYQILKKIVIYLKKSILYLIVTIFYLHLIAILKISIFLLKIIIKKQIICYII